MIKKLLEMFHEQIKINSQGGFGQNSALHMAAHKANYRIIYELEKWGADLFLRNLDNKTPFQIVPNHLLLLKIIKKLEVKRFLEFKLELVHKIQPRESLIIISNRLLLNTGEYRLFQDSLQKIKKEWLRAPTLQKRNSIFSSQTRNPST